MPKMNIKILKDKNESKVIPIVKKYTHESISEIRRNIDRERYVLTCDYYETEKLKELKVHKGICGENYRFYITPVIEKEKSMQPRKNR